MSQGGDSPAPGEMSESARRRWRLALAVVAGWGGAGVLLAAVVLSPAVLDGFRSVGPAWWRAAALTGGTGLLGFLGVWMARRRLGTAGRVPEVRIGGDLTHPAAVALRHADQWRAVGLPVLVVSITVLGPASGPVRDRWAAGDFSLPDPAATDVVGTGLVVAVMVGIAAVALVAVRRNEARAFAVALAAGPELPEVVVRRLLTVAGTPLRETALVSAAAGALVLVAALVAPSDPGPAAVGAAVALGVQALGLRGRTTALATADADRRALRSRLPDGGSQHR